MLNVRATIGILALVLLPACGSDATPGVTASPGGSPYALVQVENSAAARPQWGLQQAAIVYEYITEGGISRFSALYTSTSASRVGPVRSARRVTLHLAQIYGAVIVYSGVSTAVQQALDASGLPHVDEQSSAGNLFRVSDRPAPHNLVTDGDHLSAVVQRFTGHAPAPPLWPRTSSPPAGGRAVSRFTVPVSTSEAPVFSWDAGAGGWRRSEPDTGNVVDASTHTPVVAATVVVQQVRISDTGDVEDVNGEHGVDHTVSGNGAAQVFTAGREYDATWSQPGSGPPSLTLAGGGAAPVAPGLVWVCLVATGSAASLG